jgi:hypothetical protein
MILVGYSLATLRVRCCWLQAFLLSLHRNIGGMTPLASRQCTRPAQKRELAKLN